MKRSNSSSRPQRPLVAAIAFAATWLALPVSSVMAQSFPDYPLQTGAGNVEPNIMFILDDSGSMAFETMYNPDIDDIEACLDRSGTSCNRSINITDEAYIGNTLHYDPAQTYRPWIQADGTRMTGGTTLDAVYGSFNFVGNGTGAEDDTLNLLASGDCETYDRNGSNRTVCGADVQTFYVPKSLSNTTESYLENALNYYRYQIRTYNGSLRLIRSELMAGGGYGNFPPTTTTETVTNERIAEWDNEDFGRNDSRNFPFTLGFDATLLYARLRGDDPNAQLFLEQQGNGNNWLTRCTGVNSTSNRTSCCSFS